MPGEQHFKAIERTTRTELTPGQFGVVRLDGKAFHTYCRGLAKPFDQQFMDDMDAVAATLLSEISGVRLAYVQSDEISLILSDRSPAGDPQPFVYGGQIQKLVSIGASIASTHLNVTRLGTSTDKVGLFDARAFSLPTADDVLDYLRWRQRDAHRNSLSMIAETHFSHRQLAGVSSDGRYTMLMEIGVYPDAGFPLGFRYGRMVAREEQPGSATFTHRRTKERITTSFVRQVPVAHAAPAFGTVDGISQVLDLLGG